MTMDQFLTGLMDAAKLEGLECAEAYILSDASFECKATKGQIVEYAVNDTRGVGFRGMLNGKIGYAATEALDDEAIASLILGVKESASLSEDDSGVSIFEGEKDYPDVSAYSAELDFLPMHRKLDMCLAMEAKTLAFDKRIESVSYCIVTTGSSSVRLVNSFGLDVSYRKNNYVAYLSPIAKEDGNVSTGDSIRCGTDFNALSADELAKEAGDKAVFSLGGKPVQSGIHHIIIKSEAMAGLLRTFGGIFSAQNAQEGLSLLNGKEGECIASDIITLMDDPLLPNGLSSRPFDAEGVASRTNAVIDGGVLKTLLHNRKTAKKQGIASTGNAGKAGYAGTMRIAPTNFYFKPGTQTLDEMQKAMGEGIVITELDGLHSGANAVSGDFSLSAKGYTVKLGVKTMPVEQITVAGNFYTLLKNIRAIGNDLVFPGSGIGSASVDAGEMAIAGE